MGSIKGHSPHGSTALWGQWKVSFLILFFSLTAQAANLSSQSGLQAPGLHVEDPLLNKRVYFWKKIFSWYDGQNAILHHRDYPWIVYKVIRLPMDLNNLKFAGHMKWQWEKFLNREILNIKKQLKRVQSLTTTKPTELTEADQKLLRKFRGLPAAALTHAHLDRNFRVQRGMKNDFQLALKRSERLLPEMEKIFEIRGLPVELTRLPFIESMFNESARSHVGAVGIWQFMPDTARMYGLKINRHADDRHDPLKASQAAARFLGDYFRTFQSWPLAVTAYNHGVGGMKKAVYSSRSSHLGDIIHRYRGPTFGFAAQNFYAEFLAAVELEKYPGQYFDPFASID